MGRSERLGDRVCNVCSRPFSLLYNRRLGCSSCLLGVCRACASFDIRSKSWICFSCSDSNNNSHTTVTRTIEARSKEGQKKPGWPKKDAGAGKNSFYDDGVRDTVTEMETFAADVEEEVVLASRRHHSRSVMSRSPMIKTVEFVTINPELEDTLSVSSSSQSRPSSAALSSLSDRSMRSPSISPSSATDYFDNTPKVYIHEEEIEEVVTYEDEQEEDPSLNILTRRNSFLPDLRMEAGQCGDTECGMVTVPDTSWHHNWLFRQQLNTPRSKCPAPVSMLVPNPVSETKAKIGEQDYDQVSELSEQVSVASFAVSVSSCDDDMADIIQAEKHEADQEYTIYEQLPTRRHHSSNSSQDRNNSGDLRWISCPQDVTTHQGKIITFMCQVSGSKPLDVAWFKKLEPIENSTSKYWPYRRKDCFFLTIFDINPQDCGNYSAVAFNKTGEIRHSLEMTVKGTRRAENPPEILTHPGNSDHQVGDMLELVCQVSGYPEPRLEFYHNGNRVTDNESQRVEYREHGEWSLTVRRLGQHHSGEWSVTAENSLGSSTRDWTLAVNEQAPATPEVISAPPRFRDEVKIVKEGKQHVREERHKPQVQHNQNEKTGVYSKMSVNDSAPMAGSLADKEHRKWTENAVTMINNPYTRDNIERRQRTGGLSSRIMSSQTTDGDHGMVDTSDTGQKIYCGLRTVPSSRYNRDYFVNPDDTDRSSFRDISFSPELKRSDTNDKDDDSNGESKNWDSGVGSSSERTSTISVSEGIKRFSHVYRTGSMDSLLHDPPPLPVKTKVGAKYHSPPTPPSTRSVLRQKKVSLAEKHVSDSAKEDFEFYDNDDKYEWVDEIEPSPIPRLPSVKDLAALFQKSSVSPEPKPRKSLLKKKVQNQKSKWKGGNGSFQSLTNNSARLTNPATDQADCPDPVSAKLSADGVSVSYHVPSPPAASDYPDYAAHGDSLRRSDTSSATLPVTWSTSSLDRCPTDTDNATTSTSPLSTLHSPQLIQGPVILIGDDFDPQVMTEEARNQDYSSTSHGSSSSSGSMFYATFIPDSCIDSDEVSIVCNGYTQIDTEGRATHSNQQQQHIEEPREKITVKQESPVKLKSWKSNTKLPKLLDFWEQRNRDDKFRKYASESNICNEELPENGLRKIFKDNYFTSCEESITEDEEKGFSDYSVRSGYEDHLYEVIDGYRKVPEESGFYSFDHDNAVVQTDENDEYFSGSDEEHVTIIAVDFNHKTNQSNFSPHNKSVKNLIKIFEPENQLQVNSSLTARSAPKGQNCLNAGRQNILKQSRHHVSEEKNRVNIVYDSRLKRSSSPEHFGVPVIPAPSQLMPRYRVTEGYTSDESNLSVEKGFRRRSFAKRK